MKATKIQITHTINIHSLIHFRFFPFPFPLAVLRWCFSFAGIACTYTTLYAVASEYVVYVCKWEYTSLHFEGETVLCVRVRVCAQKPLEQRWSLCIHRYHLILISRNSEIFLLASKFYLPIRHIFFSLGSHGVCTQVFVWKCFPARKS